MWQTFILYKLDETRYFSFFKENINNEIFHHISFGKLVQIKIKGPE